MNDDPGLRVELLLEHLPVAGLDGLGVEVHDDKVGLEEDVDLAVDDGEEVVLADAVGEAAEALLDALEVAADLAGVDVRPARGAEGVDVAPGDGEVAPDLADVGILGLERAEALLVAGNAEVEREDVPDLGDLRDAGLGLSPVALELREHVEGVLVVDALVQRLLGLPLALERGEALVQVLVQAVDARAQAFFGLLDLRLVVRKVLLEERVLLVHPPDPLRALPREHLLVRHEHLQLPRPRRVPHLLDLVRPVRERDHVVRPRRAQRVLSQVPPRLRELPLHPLRLLPRDRREVPQQLPEDLRVLVHNPLLRPLVVHHHLPERPLHPGPRHLRPPLRHLLDDLRPLAHVAPDHPLHALRAHAPQLPVLHPPLGVPPRRRKLPVNQAQRTPQQLAGEPVDQALLCSCLGASDSRCNAAATATPAIIPTTAAAAAARAVLEHHAHGLLAQDDTQASVQAGVVRCTGGLDVWLHNNAALASAPGSYRAEEHSRLDRGVQCLVVCCLAVVLFLLLLLLLLLLRCSTLF